MFEQLLSPGYMPFTIALGVLIGLMAIEIVTMIAGHSASQTFDGLVDGDVGHAFDSHAHDGLFGSVLDWLNAGRVPLLILLGVALGCFSAGGFLIQSLARGLLAPLPTWIAIPAAIAAAVPATRWVGRLVSHIMPREETYVAESVDFVGRTGVVTVGPVRRGVVARMKVQDRFGNWHFPKIEPFVETDEIAEGVLVLVVEQHAGTLRVAKAEGKLAES
jgi:hypothetical protein